MIRLPNFKFRRDIPGDMHSARTWPKSKLVSRRQNLSSSFADEEPRLIVQAAARSIRGNKRPRNEDCVFCSSAAAFFVVADGMGGHPGGREASRIVVETFARNLGDPSRLTDLTGAEIQKLIEYTTLRTRRHMERWAEAHPRCNSMGSTMVLGLIIGERLYYANMGDSRIYRFCNGKLELLSHDETLAQALQDAGAISPREAMTSHFRHQLVNFIGVRKLDHLPTSKSCELKQGNRILLATDGLTGVVSMEEMADVLSTEVDTKHAVDELIRLALLRDSHDNISAVLADIGPSATIPVRIGHSTVVDGRIDASNCMAVA